MLKTKTDRRYQDCQWYEKLWRRRYYIIVPFNALIFWWQSRKNEYPFQFKTCLSLSIGLAQSKMNWVYDWKELRRKMKAVFVSNKSKIKK